MHETKLIANAPSSLLPQSSVQSGGGGGGVFWGDYSNTLHPMESIIQVIETLTMNKSGQEDEECVTIKMVET